MVESLKPCVFRRNEVPRLMLPMRDRKGEMQLDSEGNPIWFESKVPAIITTGSDQNFDCGICTLLTSQDIGPIACEQPQHDEQTCPDIAEYRKSKN